METGLIMMPGALITGVMMPVVGRLYDRIGPRLVTATGILFLVYTTYLFHYINTNTPTSTIWSTEK